MIFGARVCIRVWDIRQRDSGIVTCSGHRRERAFGAELSLGVSDLFGEAESAQLEDLTFGDACRGRAGGRDVYGVVDGSGP